MGGDSGNATFLINSPEDFDCAFVRLGGVFKASRYLPDVIPLSTHVCISDEAVHYEGPFIQLIGFPTLSSHAFQYCGNETNQSLLDARLKSELRRMSFVVAEYAQAARYRGIFGIDYLWDQRRGLAFLQEINAQLVGTTRLLTGMEREQGVPLTLLRHLAAFGVRTPSAPSTKNLAEVSLEGPPISQLFISNNLPYATTVRNYLTPGIYGLNGDAIKMKSSIDDSQRHGGK